MPEFVYTPPLAAGLATLAWIRQATGDPAGALDAIGEAMRAAPIPAGLLNPVPAQRARLLLAQGNLDAAARWTTDRGLAADDEPDYPRERGHLVLARVLLHSTGRARHWRCWTGCMRRRSPRTGSAVSSRPGR